MESFSDLDIKAESKLAGNVTVFLDTKDRAFERHESCPIWWPKIVIQLPSGVERGDGEWEAFRFRSRNAVFATWYRLQKHKMYGTNTSEHD